MNPFLRKKCTVVFWNHDATVYGLNISANKNKLLVLQSASALNTEFGLKNNLAAVCRELNPEGEILTVGGAAINGSVIFEIPAPALPDKDLLNALAFEIPRHLPLPQEECLWTFRKFAPPKEAEAKSKVRVWALPRKEWENTIAIVADSGIKLDYIVNPFMAENESASGFSFYLPQLEKNLSFAFNHESFREMQFVSNAFESQSNFKDFIDKNVDWDLSLKDLGGKEQYFPCIMLALFALSNDFSMNRNFLPELPQGILPSRCRNLKVAAIILGIASVAALLGLGFRNWSDSYSRLAAVKTEKGRVLRSIEKIRKSNISNRETDLTVKKIYEASPGNPEILQCLHFLSEALPENMYLQEFNSSGNAVELAIRTGGEGDTDSIAWNKTKLYSPENVRKRRNSDGSSDIYLKIICKTPDEIKIPTGTQ